MWKCDDHTARFKTCRAIRAALSDARMVGGFDGGTSQVHTGSELAAGARSFKKTTSTGGDNWPLHELARVQQADLDRLGEHMSKWKKACVRPPVYVEHHVIDS